MEKQNAWIEPWFLYYRNNSQRSNELKKILSNWDKLAAAFLAKPFFDERGFSFYKGLGWGKFCEATLALVAQALVSLIAPKKFLKILLAFKGSAELMPYLEIFDGVFSFYDHKVYRFQKSPMLESVIAETLRHLDLDLVVYLSYQASEKRYYLKFLDGQGLDLELPFYQNLVAMMAQTDLAQIKSLARSPQIIKKDLIYEQYKIHNLKISERLQDEKTLKIFFNSDSLAFQELASKIFGSLDYPYLLAKPKMLNFWQPKRFNLKNFWAKDYDLALFLDEASQSFEIALKQAKKERVLKDYELLIFFFEHYFLAQKIANQISSQAYIIIPEYYIFFLKDLLIKYEISVYAYENYQHLQLDEKACILALDDKQRFRMQTVLPYFSQMQFFIIFMELMNYLKTQKGNLIEVFENTMRTYPEIKHYQEKMIITFENYQLLIKLLEENLIKEKLVNKLYKRFHPHYLLIFNETRDLLLQFIYDRFALRLKYQVFTIGKKLDHNLLELIIDKLNKIVNHDLSA